MTDDNLASNERTLESLLAVSKRLLEVARQLQDNMARLERQMLKTALASSRPTPFEMDIIDAESNRGRH